MNEYFMYEPRCNTVKTVKSRTLLTGQKGSKALTTALAGRGVTPIIIIINRFV